MHATEITLVGKEGIRRRVAVWHYTTSDPQLLVRVYRRPGDQTKFVATLVPVRTFNHTKVSGHAPYMQAARRVTHQAGLKLKDPQAGWLIWEEEEEEVVCHP